MAYYVPYTPDSHKLYTLSKDIKIIEALGHAGKLGLKY